MQSTDVKTKNNVRKLTLSIVSLLLIICVLLITFGKSIGIPNWNEIFTFCGIYADLGNDISFSFVNVGSADACYIKCHDKNILIDSGTSIGYDKLSAYLKRNGCTHFDAVIVSHPDSDHIGGMSNIIADFGIDVIYMSRMSDDIIPKTDEYKSFVNSVEENKIKIIYPEMNTKVEIGDMKLVFISPQKQYDSTNDNSLVVRLAYKDISALFTGDISKNVESDLLNSDEELKSDILKVAHHGSKTSSTENFLNAVSPEISVVSVGSSDSSLPDYNTMARIYHYSDSLYRTDEDKTVVVTSDGKTLAVQTHA